RLVSRDAELVVGEAEPADAPSPLAPSGEAQPRVLLLGLEVSANCAAQVGDCLFGGTLADLAHEGELGVDPPSERLLDLVPIYRFARFLAAVIFGKRPVPGEARDARRTQECLLL